MEKLKGRKIIISGDFNFDTQNMLPRQQSVFDVISGFGLNILSSDDPTRLGRHLDYICFPAHHPPVRILTFDFINSDHRGLISQLQLKSPQEGKTIFKRAMKNFRVEDLILNLKKYVETTPCCSLDSFCIKIQCEMDIRAPMKKTIFRSTHSSSVSPAIKTLMKTRSKLLRQYNKTRLPADRSKYIEIRKLCQKTYRRQFRKDMKEKLLKSDSKQFYKTLSNISPIKTNTSSLNPSQLEDAAKYFSSITKDIPYQPNNDFEAVKSKPGLRFKFREVTEEDIEKSLKSFPLNSSPGQDGVDVRTLRAICTTFIPDIRRMFTDALMSHSFPPSMKRSLIHPIPKVSNSSDITNFRPISLLTLMSKLLEKTIKIQLEIFTEQYLSFRQFGFRKSLSTEAALITVDHQLRQAISNHDIGILVLLDFSKAFDTVRIDRMIEKLKRIGFDNGSCNFFRSYLSGRSSCVVIDGICSSDFDITMGVPQGSVLGPIIFLLYSADITNVVSHSELTLYADDSQLFFKAKSYKEVYKLQKDLDAISLWARLNGLKLNGSKTQLLLVGQKNVKFSPLLKMNGYVLKASDYVKNLGIKIDNKLQYTQQINDIVKKASFSLSRLARLRSVLNQKSAKMLLETFVIYPSLYASCVWGFSISQTNMTRLQKLENWAA